MQFRPVEPTQHARHSLALLVPAALAVVALLALFFVWQWAQEPRGARPQEARALTPTSSQIGDNSTVPFNFGTGSRPGQQP